MTVKLSLAVLWMSSIASASPAYELTELMTRAQTVALVTIDKRDAHGITVRAKTVYRGWLLYPVRHVHGHDVVDPTRLTARDGEVRIDTLGAVVAKHPYREAGE